MVAEVSGVAVVGSISVDLTAYASPLPRPGETVIAEGFAMATGGKGANQAIAAARAGAQTYLVGAVGDDVFGRLALDELAAAGVHTEDVEKLSEAGTGVAHIRVDATSGQNDIAISPRANAALTPARAEAALRRLADRAAVVLVQLETPLETVRRVAEVCDELGLRLVLDPAPAQPLPPDIWPLVSVVTPNETEAVELTGLEVSPESTAEAVERAGAWFVARGVGTAVVTCGERGAVVVNASGATGHPTRPVRAVDTTAAGDAFTGVLGAELALGHSWPAAVDRALAAGALAVTVPGAAPSLPTREQVDALLGSAGP